MTLEFKTYRNFHLEEDSFIGFRAVHEDYDGPEDNRYFHTTEKDSGKAEQELLHLIDEWHEDRADEIIRGICGLFDFILHRNDLPSEISTVIRASWRYSEMLDYLDSSRGTEKTDERG